MPNQRDPNLDRVILALALAATLLLSWAFLYFTKIRYHFEWFTVFLGAFVGLIQIYVFLFLRILRRNPVSLTIALLGHPSAGKTVYLTVLFDELQRSQVPGIRFAPYGQETVERLATDITILGKGGWLPRTESGSVFYYRAYATLTGGLVRKRFKLEIGDFAGERLGELDSADEKWLHKTEYFKYVIQSEAVLFAIDAHKLWTGPQTLVEETQNAFVAALQILAEAKGVTENRKLRAPVCLLFLKADLLLPDVDVDRLLSRVPRLAAICQQRCLNFKSFLVSSVGHLGRDRTPPEHLEPRNVIDPIVWLLKRVSTET